MRDSSCLRFVWSLTSIAGSQMSCYLLTMIICLHKKVPENCKGGSHIHPSCCRKSSSSNQCTTFLTASGHAPQPVHGLSACQKSRRLCPQRRPTIKLINGNLRAVLSFSCVRQEKDEKKAAKGGASSKCAPLWNPPAAFPSSAQKCSDFWTLPAQKP